MDNYDDKFYIKGGIRKKGNSFYCLLDPHIVEYLNVKDFDDVFMIPDVSKHGKFVGIWNPKQQSKKKSAK